MGLARGVALACAAIALAVHPESAAWSCAQLVHALWPFHSAGARLLEQWAWARWEAGAREQRAEPLVEVSLRVEEADGELRFTRPDGVDLSRPFVVRGLLNATGTLGGQFGSTGWLTDGPVGRLEIDYFSDAAAAMAIVPDARARLTDVVANITAGGRQKIGTEMIFRAFPQAAARAPATRAAVGALQSGRLPSSLRPRRSYWTSSACAAPSRRSSAPATLRRGRSARASPSQCSWHTAPRREEAPTRREIASAPRCAPTSTASRSATRCSCLPAQSGAVE